MSELPLCPFCTGTPYFTDKTTRVVGCGDCGASAPSADWNERHPIFTKADVEAVRHVLGGFIPLARGRTIPQAARAALSALGR